MNNYTVYHLHSDLSLLDSDTKFSDYVDKAIEEGMTSIASTEHGKPSGWVAKKLYCESKGIKFIHGVEIYLTEQLEPKVRDNYHTVLLARNLDGVHELNRLIELSTRPDHTYYNNRITFDEFLAISPNIIKISACLASPLNRLPPYHPRYCEILRHYDYLEVQPWDDEDQADYNTKLYSYSKRYNIPLIAGTDTHSLNDYKAECRDILMWRKEQFYPGEEKMSLTWFSYDDLVSAFDRQGALPRSAYLDAIENTNVMAASVDDFKLDRSIRYPILYGSPEEDTRRYNQLAFDRLADKINRGIIPRDQEQAFRDALTEELRVFEKIGMSGFMLCMSELITWCRENNIYTGPARGSVGGSRAAYVTDIIDLNPEQWHTVFSRFCNEDRVEIGDIDVDVIEKDRPAIFKHIIEVFGEQHTARVASYGTIKDLAFIDDAAGGLAVKYEWENHPEKFNEKRRMKVKNDFSQDNPYLLSKVKKIKDLFKSSPDEAREKYPDLFYYYDGLVETKISQSVHPAGMIISPVVLDSEYGVFWKDGERCLLLDMDELHEVGAAKFDFLILKTVQVIHDTYAMLGEKPPRMDQIDWNDQRVWKEISRDASSVFQFESEFAAESLMRYSPKSIFDMSLVTAALRPSGTSYRDALLAHQTHRNPSALIDNLLKNNHGFLVYQEDIIAFLQQVCGLSGSEADTVRRGIARKKPEILEKALPRILEGYCSQSDKPRAQAEQECNEFLKIIEDASSYMFGYNHSIAYCLLSYMCGYLRTYYPMQWIAAYMMNAANDEDIATGKAMALQRGIKFTRPKFGQDNRAFSVDTDSGEISDSITAIKGVGLKDAEALYALAKRGTYEYFVDLLWDMLTYPNALNRTVIKTLIMGGYFRDFGSSGKLLNLFYEFFDGQNKVYQGLKDATVSARMDRLRFEETFAEESNIPLHDQIAFEIETYGSPVTVDASASGQYAAVAVDTKYSPKITLYNISRGTTGMMKVLKPAFMSNPIKAGDIVYLKKWHKAPAYTFSNGARSIKPGASDLWIDDYDVIA